MTRYDLRNAERKYAIEVSDSGKALRVQLDGKNYIVRVDPKGTGDYSVTIDGKPVLVKVEELSPQSVRIRLGEETLTFIRGTEASRAARGTPEPEILGDVISAPMPGRVISVAVTEGQVLKEGDTVVIIESMKMESSIKSDRAGKVSEVLVKEGAPVKRHQPLVRLS